MIDKIIKIALDILLAIVILIACIYFITGLIHKDMTMANVFGYKPIYVASGSMEPTLMTGDYVICKIIDANDVKIGDICTYIRDGKTIIHRVVDITADGFIFKGDNNHSPDVLCVSANQIRAKVVYPH